MFRNPLVEISSVEMDGTSKLPFIKVRFVTIAKPLLSCCCILGEGGSEGRDTGKPIGEGTMGIIVVGAPVGKLVGKLVGITVVGAPVGILVGELVVQLVAFGHGCIQAPRFGQFISMVYQQQLSIQFHGLLDKLHVPFTNGIPAIHIKLLLLRVRFRSCRRPPNCCGIVPFKSLVSSSKYCRDARLPISNGIVPVKLLLDKIRFCCVILPISGGIVPFKLLLLRSKYIASVRLLIPGGIVPLM